MSKITDEARAEAERLTLHTEDHGRSEWLFIEGAEWALSRPITDEQVEAAAKAIWSDVHLAAVREILLDLTRAALEAARGVDHG